MKVLVLEPHAAGHHGPYLQWMVEGLVKRGFNVTVVTLQESLKHPCIQKVTESEGTSGNPLRVILTQDADIQPKKATRGVTRFAMHEFAYWRMFRAWYDALLHTEQPEVVFLPYLDYCLYAIGLLGSPFRRCPWVGLAMRPSFHYREMDVIAPRPALAGIKKYLFFRLLKGRSLRRLLTIDEPLFEYLAKNEFFKKAILFPEPAEMTDSLKREEAKESFGFSVERKLILVYGSITVRKGVLELVRAMKEPSFPDSVDVVLAGAIARDIQDYLSSSQNAGLISGSRLRLLDRFIEPSEEARLFAASDMVWLGYRNHYGGSGVLVQAMAANRPVLASEEGVIGWRTKKHALGKTFKTDDPNAVCDAIREQLESNGLFSGIYSFERERNPVPTFSKACDILAKSLVDRRGEDFVSERDAS